VTTVEQILRPEPERDRWGRYLIPTPDGKKKAFTRVTTFAASIDDRWNLEQWKLRMVATGLVNRSDLFAQVAAHVGDKQKLNRLCDDAVEAAKGSAGANLGTALHAFTEQVDLGLEPTIPAPWDADVAAYLGTLQANGVRVTAEFVERIVVLHQLGLAGTFDRLVTIDGHPLPLIADLKTGNLEHASAFGAIAVQLACYANADELYDPATGATTPMPEVDRSKALVIHLPAGKATCTLHLVDIEAGWKAAQLCAAVRDWRKRKDLASPFVNVTDQRARHLTDRAAVLRDQHPEAFAELAANWPTGVPTFKQGGHTDLHLQQIDTLLSTIEAKHSVAFATGTPVNGRCDKTTVAAMKARLEALPADLLDALRDTAKTLAIPNIEGRTFTVAHAAVLEELLVDAEQATAARQESAA